jgi:hypothetical protein
MSAFYIKLQSTALRLITDKGKTFVLRVTSGGTFNPATNAITGQTVTDHNIKAVSVNKTKDDRQLQYAGIDPVKNYIKVLLVAAKDLAVIPTTSDIIFDGSKQYKIISVNPLQPADIILVYEIKLGV